MGWARGSPPPCLDICLRRGAPPRRAGPAKTQGSAAQQGPQPPYRPYQQQGDHAPPPYSQYHGWGGPYGQPPPVTTAPPPPPHEAAGPRALEGDRRREADAEEAADAVVGAADDESKDRGEDAQMPAAAKMEEGDGSTAAPASMALERGDRVEGRDIGRPDAVDRTEEPADEISRSNNDNCLRRGAPPRRRRRGTRRRGGGRW